MRSRRTQALPARLEKVQRRFEHWRGTRESRSCIPDALWVAAVKLCATYGIHRTAQALRLNADSLKKRVVLADGQNSTGRDESATFVELAPSDLSCASECLIELEHPRGVKMRIRLTGRQSPEIVTALSQVFIGAGP